MTTEALDVDAKQLGELCRRHQIRRLALFGSAARGELREDGDIDLLVDFLPGTRVGLRFITIQDELAALLGSQIDLGTWVPTSGSACSKKPCRSMRPPEDEVLLRDMLDHARRAADVARNWTRTPCPRLLSNASSR